MKEKILMTGRMPDECQTTKDESSLLWSFVVRHLQFMIRAETIFSRRIVL
jgi:hypothetical protein